MPARKLPTTATVMYVDSVSVNDSASSAPMIGASAGRGRSSNCPSAISSASVTAATMMSSRSKRL
jgi:hypothetical protein